MKKINKKINYGEALKNLSDFPGNPFDIHRIQDALLALQGDDNFLRNIIRETAGKDIDGALKLVLDGAEDNLRIMQETVGEKLLADIMQLAKTRNRVNKPNPDDLPPSLFQSPGVFGYLGDN